MQLPFYLWRCIFIKRIMTMSNPVQMQCNWCKGSAARWTQQIQQQSVEYRHTKLQAVRRLLQKLRIVYLFFFLADTHFFLSTHVASFCGFQTLVFALPLPDSSRTTIISVESSIVEAHRSRTAFPRTVLRHLLALLVEAVSVGTCLLMMAIFKATRYVHVASIFRA